MNQSLTAFELLWQIDQRCRLLAADLPSQPGRQDRWSGIGFRLGEHWYVTPMGEVSEVLHEPRCTQLPGVKPWVKGVANLRGRLLPIMDLCGFFGHELSPLRKQRRVLVVEHNDVFAGLLVDEVFGLQHFEQDSFAEPLEIPSPTNDRVRIQLYLTRYGNNEHLMLVRDVTRIHQLEQMRKDFVANVSHELRTPLTVITGYLETLLDNVEDVNPRWSRALQQMSQQGSRMQTLLNDLLLLAKLEATDYPSDNLPVPVDALLQSIKGDAQALSGPRNQRISLEAAPGVKLKGSESELRSAFSNLVFNAVKYTQDEGSIRIRWWADAQGAHLSVQDSGVGIDAKHLPRLTERFYRVDSSRASNTGGTGLGLAIVKHVLMRHRGKLEISSVPGHGSTFTCHFAPAQLANEKA